MKVFNSLLLVLVLALAARVAPAQTASSPPGQLNYQGFLTDASGILLATNAPRNYTVNFRIYDASTGGNFLWGEQQVVTVDRGYFAVALGSGSGISTNEFFTNDLSGVFSGLTASDRYIGMTVTELGGGEIVPRLQLLASPYALLARNATALISPNGSNLVTAANGQLTVNGTIAGDGSGLTNLAAASLTNTLTLAQLPAVVLTNGASGVTLTGTMCGNGAGLTNIPVSAVLPPPPGMVLIPAGSFTMGNSVGDSDIYDGPLSVYVSVFYMDVNLVTWSQWQSVYYWATNHGYTFVNAGAGKAANHPVQMVDWYDCVKWCNARSEQAGGMPVYYTDPGMTRIYTNGETDAVYPNWAAKGYRLPTEAEWEKAARGAVAGQRFPWGNLLNANLANYYGSTNQYPYDLGPNGYNTNFMNGGVPYTSPVGYFAPNGYGLNDMAGNVLQWCWDWHGVYAGGSDPHGPAPPGDGRILRGGTWGWYADPLRCARRMWYWGNHADNGCGFRCVRGL